MAAPNLTLLNQTAALNELFNGSIVYASELSFYTVIGWWVYFILYILTVVMVYIKTEEPTYVTLITILANIFIYWRISIYDPMRALTEPIFWTFFVISLALTLYLFWGSGRRE